MAAVLHNICIFGARHKPSHIDAQQYSTAISSVECFNKRRCGYQKMRHGRACAGGQWCLGDLEVSHRSLQHRCSTIIRYNVFDGELCTHHLKLHCNCVSFSRHGSNTDAAVLQGRDPTIDRRISESIHCSLRHIGEGDFQWVDILDDSFKAYLKILEHDDANDS